MNVIDWLNATAFTLINNPVTWVEVIGFVTGAACVWGVARQKIWNWPVGILNNVAFAILFLGAGLYGETLLQVIFAVIAVYGWIKWSRGASGSAGSNDLLIRSATRAETLAGVAAVVLATAAIAYLLHAGTDSQVPIPDAFVLAASLVATYAQAKKIFEHWYVWIVIDLVSIPLYFSRGLALTAILYIGFLGLCIYGLVGWNRIRATKSPELATAGV
ncbi:nicotinamide mononucleotide transporter [Arthrobacter alpinus]|uniref:nicotinamide riboside transporter PnuC n=1 Tax=Arthrobacter alpinus TaxID=656366 RepID=UPI0005C8163C|nr:nicotinamide riboside transporter PnuC [Arthrobacter alpinus]ALV46473.1 nicotinamide mononucleotide transporter [Arthrobacter alpinus]